MMRSPIDKNGEARDFECNEPINGRVPLPAKRREGFIGFLDIV